MTDRVKDILLNFPHLYYGQFRGRIDQSELAEFYSNTLKNNSSIKIKFIGRSFITYQRMQWDSDFFGYEVYSIENIFLENENDKKGLKNFINQLISEFQIKYLFIRINVKQTIEINFLIEIGMYYLGSKYLTECDFESTRRISRRNDFHLVEFEETYRKDIIDMSLGNFKNNRFFVDPLIPNESADAIYQNWILSEVSNSPQNILLAFSKDKLVGFVIIEEKKLINGEPSGFVKLITIDKNFKQQGWGRDILQRAMEVKNKNDIEFFVANIVASNVASLKMFQSKNFFIKETLMEFRKICYEN